MKAPLTLLLATLLFGCAADRGGQAAFPEKGYSVSGKDPFRFEVDPALLRQWGGAGSLEFNRVLDAELERQKICRNGYSLRHAHVRDGVFSVIGRCKS